MELELFRGILKKAKKSSKYVHLNQLKVVHYTNSNPDECPDEWIITQKPEQEVCSKCGHHLSEDCMGVSVKFEKVQEHLTIFEEGLLFMLFFKNEIPLDYARWDRCEAGQRFIENIKEVRCL